MTQVTQLTEFIILIMHLQVVQQDNVIVDLIQEMVFIGIGRGIYLDHSSSHGGGA